MDRVFAQCWTANEDSDALWRIYSPNHLAVAVQTTVDLLSGQLKASVGGKGFKRSINRVIYRDENSIREVHAKIIDVMGSDQPTHVISALFFKRKQYSHEEEVRAIIYDAERTCGNQEYGLKVSVDPHALIQGVTIDPRAPDEYVDAYTHYLQDRLGFGGSISKSDLYRKVDRVSCDAESSEEILARAFGVN